MKGTFALTAERLRHVVLQGVHNAERRFKENFAQTAERLS